MAEEVKNYVCKVCNNEYDSQGFYKSKNNKNGLDRYCKTCRKKSTKKYADNNKPKIKASWKKYSKKYSKKLKKHRKENPEIVREKDKKNHSKENSLYSNAKYKNKKRGIAFLLTFEEFCRIRAPKACFYCKDVLPIQGYGIDRIDPSKPYVLENCVPCCTFCNIAKSNHSKEVFFAKIEQIYKISVLSFAK